MISLKQTRVIVTAVVTLSVIALIAQNTESVETKFLFMKFSMPRAALLLVSFLGGLVTGMLFAGRVLRKKEK